MPGLVCQAIDTQSLSDRKIQNSGKLVRLGIWTHNPRNDSAFYANRAITDPALRRFPIEGKCDFVVDWAADPTWGPDSAAANQALYPDGTHPSQAGQNNMEAEYFRPVLDSFPAPSVCFKSSMSTVPRHSVDRSA